MSTIESIIPKSENLATLCDELGLADRAVLYREMAEAAKAGDARLVIELQRKIEADIVASAAKEASDGHQE